MPNRRSALQPYSATFPAEAGAVARARADVAALASECGLSADGIYDVRLAVSEVMTNAILHAYADKDGEIRIKARFVKGELRIVIADDGPGMAPRVGSPGLGLGLPTVATVASGLDIVTPKGGGTEVHLIFRCPEAG